MNCIALEIGVMKIYDKFNGIQAINEARIRILHSGSFIDDPTRIFRAIRFHNRLEFATGEQFVL